jgi:hypothetical protein
MANDRAILQALGLPVFVPRQAEVSLPSHALIVLVEERQADFTPAHHTQLQKIMQYLSLPEYVLLYADSDLACKTPRLLHFGATSNLPQAHHITQTHSISKMLAEPACKKQVLHDLQALKSA